MKRIKLSFLKFMYDSAIRRGLKFKRRSLLSDDSLRRIKLCIERALHESRNQLRAASLLAALLYAAANIAVAQPADLVANIFRPFRDAVAVLFAVSFGIGILGFFFIVIDAVISWVTGGGFGRSLAVSKFLKAAETLAIIPLLFILVNVLKNIGIPELYAVAEILNSLLNEGWKIILAVFTG
ncbi:MAG: hypothetical protein LM590_01700 [Thermofilum sp.]|nr:hypothetical protein [Thermofilum sp.]